METTLRPEKRSRIYGIIGTLAWMLLAFVAGVGVGMHPQWIPNMPWAYNPNTELPTDSALPGSSTQPSAATQPIQPSPAVH